MQIFESLKNEFKVCAGEVLLILRSTVMNFSNSISFP